MRLCFTGMLKAKDRSVCMCIRGRHDDDAMANVDFYLLKREKGRGLCLEYLKLTQKPDEFHVPRLLYVRRLTTASKVHRPFYNVNP